MRMIPNILTLLNLFSGCIGLVYVFTEQFYGAILCVGFSLLFDFMDGLMARLLKQQHPYGGDLDSLADVVSFGVLPGAMYYSVISGLPLVEPIPWMVFVGFIFTLFGAYRLARFNVMHGSEAHFSGLPIPSAAIFVTGLYWIDHSPGCESCASAFINPYVIFGSIFFLSYLMVSSLPHFSFKVKGMGWRGQEIQWIYVILVLCLILLVKEVAVSLSIVLYVFMSLIYFSFTSKQSS